MSQQKLSVEEATSAAQIQRAIDALAADGGGRLVLPAMVLELDRGLELRSGVELVGQGEDTVLRKGPGRVYPFSGYHNYGMCDVPLRSAAGLEPGMTVSVHDNRTHGGFFETFATITWVDGDWIGLDHGVKADYYANEEPVLTTVYPLVFGHDIHQAALKNIHLEGNRAANEKAMGGCRGGAVYFAGSRDITVEGVTERDYYGEGLSFQMCRDVRIINCRFDANTGNGLHPGAGSTNVLFEGCGGAGNQRAGFFFCVRANHISVRDCEFKDNGLGVSIGTRDCYNLIEDCRIEANHGVGILVRPTPRPTEVHSIMVRRCSIRGNAGKEGGGQVEITSDAHDLIFSGNQIEGLGNKAGAGFAVAGSVHQVYLEDNRIEACASEVEAEAQSLTTEKPKICFGYGEAKPEAFRHLPMA